VCTTKPALSFLLARGQARHPAAHFVEPDQGPVHHPLTGTDLGGGNRRVGAVAALRNGLNGREILLIVVAVTQEKDVLQPGAALQGQGVATEELAADADETDSAVEQDCRQARANALTVLPVVEGDQLRKERPRERQLHRLVL